MTERPVLFSGPMVRALLAGTKTQTRRIMRTQPIWHSSRAEWEYESKRCTAHWTGPKPVACASMIARDDCPYGATGDLLWVRECWAPDPEPGDLGLTGYTWYRADHAEFLPQPERWRPSSHMPRALSRITIRVDSVRVERLQDISEEDARSEGACELPLQEGAPGAWWRVPGTGMGPHRSARAAFKALWESIHGADSWTANPWVWVIGFERAGVHVGVHWRREQ